MQLSRRSPHTDILAKGCYCLIRTAVEIQIPSYIRLRIGLEAALDRHIILADDGLAVEDEERGDPVRLPQVKLVLDPSLDTGQATEGRDQRLMARKNLEVELEKVCRVDGDRTVFDFAQGMPPGGGRQSVSSKEEKGKEGPGKNNLHGLVENERVPRGV